MRKVNMTKTATGMIYPTDCLRSAKEVEREGLENKYKEQPLVITDPEGRKEVGELFHKLINHICIRGNGIPLPGYELKKVRKQLVKNLAKQLLGQDTEFEEYC